MAFVKRTWLARIGIGLNKFLIGDKDSQGKQTLVNDPDSISQAGDVISADNLNDLEDRIDNAFGDVNTALGDVNTALGLKSNLLVTQTIEFDLDIESPTIGDVHYVTKYVTKLGYTLLGIIGWEFNLINRSTYAKEPFDTCSVNFTTISLVPDTWDIRFGFVNRSAPAAGLTMTCKARLLFVSKT